MLRVVDAELRRMVRRWSYWVLTAVVVTVVGVVAWYNVASLRSARDIYQQAVATAERCERDGGAACPQLGQVTASSYGVGLSDATSGTSQQAQPTQPLTVDEVLQQSINDADRNLEVTLSAMSPGNWPRLSLARTAVYVRSTRSLEETTALGHGRHNCWRVSADASYLLVGLRRSRSLSPVGLGLPTYCRLSSTPLSGGASSP